MPSLPGPVLPGTLEVLILRALGRKQLDSETAKWRRVVDGLAHALRAPSGG